MNSIDILFRLLVAIVPPLLLLAVTYLIDWKEREPLSLLAALFGMGVVSYFVSFLWELVMFKLVELLPMNEVVLNLLKAFLIVSFGEELFKFLFLKLGSWKNKSFNYRFDGIVYAVYVSLGFGLTENIFYVLQYGVRTALFRSISSIPLHASCGVIMGIFYGYARGCMNAGNQKGTVKNYKLGLIIPIIIHGFYDFSIKIDTIVMGIVWIVFTIALFLIVMNRLMKYSVWDHTIVDVKNQVNVYGEVTIIPNPDAEISPSCQLMKESQRYDSYGQTQEINLVREQIDEGK